VYVSLPLRRQSELYKLVQEIILDAKDAVPTLREIWPDQNSCQRPELHISLSRPILLRAHQREELKRSVKNIAHSQKP
jgi:ribonuclease P protein component